LYCKIALCLIVGSMRDLSNVHVGVVGLGLMGSSIVAALLLAGHSVVAIAPVANESEDGRLRILHQLDQCREAGFTQRTERSFSEYLTISEDYITLSPCSLVIECVIERIDIKASVYRKVAEVVSEKAIISSNTSAIPVSELQKRVTHPERFLGIHWAEPAYMTRFLEITCGEETSPEKANEIFELAHLWGKEPTLLKKDIRGFITNRLMYAVYREIFHAFETGKATKEDLDKAFRYDAGSWITLMGVFRRMDFMGLKDFDIMLRNVLPQLSNTDKVPELMQKLIADNAKGIYNSKGIYSYSNGEASQWEEAFARFNNEIHTLAASYSADKVKQYLAS
jgi:3-hydroxybutyryl-CoA dehydrogenase